MRAERSDAAEDVARLRWRCRRGMRELDVLLVRWLDNHWAGAAPAQRRAFETLLDQEDDLLWDWLTGRRQPESPALKQLIDTLANAPR